MFLEHIVRFLALPGNMILIKDRHMYGGSSYLEMTDLGNMILIKDRHESGSLFIVGTRTNMSGKYDTYKGSIP